MKDLEYTINGLKYTYYKEVPGLYKNGELFLSFEELLKKDYVYVIELPRLTN